MMSYENKFRGEIGRVNLDPARLTRWAIKNLTKDRARSLKRSLAQQDMGTLMGLLLKTEGPDDDTVQVAL